MASGQKKISKKRKAIEEKVLAKARKYVKLSVDEPSEQTAETLPPEVADAMKPDATPRVKLRKPRWDEEKFQQRRNEISATGGNEADNKQDKSASETKSKKKRNKKKKKKKQKQVTDEALQLESEKRHMEQALDYLRKWDTNRDEWKFEKLKQIRLLKNALNPSFIEEDDFETLLKYVGTIKGKARSIFMSEMIKFVEDGDSKMNLNDEAKQKYERARQILQMLHEDSD